LNVQGKSPVEILKIVDAFLIKNYRYSLQLTGKDTAATPLSTFLLKTRAGHCEYFASATTLILRALGIPARYTVGYSVHEFSNLEQQYIVRSRHAHAWTMVYINDKWQVFDTTPADWTSIENAGFSNRFYRISAIWDFWGFKISSWLRQLRSSGMINYIWWLLLPIFLLMLKKSVPQKAVKRVFKPQEISAINHKQERVNQDSEFYLVEQALIELGFARNPAESLKSWIARIKRENPTSELMDELSSLIELHYRYRFDPQGVEDVERENLKSAVNSWLNQLKIKN
jgi:hypothetical protein